MAAGVPESGLSFVKLRDYVHESNLIEGIDSEQADTDGQEAWRHLLSRTYNHKPLTHAIIQKLQEELTTSQEMSSFWRGVYRDRNRVRVQVGGVEALKPEHVGRAMDEWLELYSTRSPYENHVAFEKIHPFADGNGRTGRMLMWYQEYRAGLKPTLIRYSDREEYYNWFREAEAADTE
jgi:Fic family protein